MQLRMKTLFSATDITFICNKFTRGYPKALKDTGVLYTDKKLESFPINIYWNEYMNGEKKIKKNTKKTSGLKSSAVSVWIWRSFNSYDKPLKSRACIETSDITLNIVMWADITVIQFLWLFFE